MTDTLLVLSEMGIPRYSARGLEQTLAPIAAAGVVRRTINGELADFSYAAFRKYASKITCRDQRAPALDGIWIGQVLTVACVAELAYPESSTPQRVPVSGSQRTEDGFVFYRPVLSMMVTGFNTATDEWAADVQWELELEEV
jgi:hypothetical protein